jgi:diaminopimelate decarboxylase
MISSLAIEEGYMQEFSHKRGQLHCEDVSMTSLAERYGTPLYVYSRKAFLSRLAEIQNAFAEVDPLICYSIKANGNLSILRMLAKAGSGFDAVSGGEIFRAIKAGAKARKIVYAGVGKTHDEIAQALDVGIHMFNAESEAEVCAINDVAARMGVTARVALRLNPDVDARTHAKTTTATKENKFGIDLHTARAIFAARARHANVDLCGIHVHLGSPIYTVAPYRSALRKVKLFVAEVRSLGAQITSLNVGGGFPISYDGKQVLDISAYAKVIMAAAKDMGLSLCLEPGRYIAGNSGVLLSRVVYNKEGWLKRKFVIINAAMNDLQRPAMYGSYHHIWPVKGVPSPAFGKKKATAKRKTTHKVDIVGPVCESSDCFGKDRPLPPVESGDILAIYSTGAYGMTMASVYNGRPRPAEVLVNGSNCRIIRRRENYEDLIRGE